MHNNGDPDFRFIAWASGLGAIIGVGKLLDSGERLTYRIVVGRAIVSAGLAAISPALLTFFPAMPRAAEFAFAALFASLGTSTLQFVVRRIAGIRN